ncbi:MAG TPA: RNA polymerase sigma factor [Chloroflexota bacterium]|nr:RNA polymerase sigma factor [Chloroflexota bacterium]
MSGASGDEVLVQLAVRGDRAAFGALVTPHVTDLTRLCRRVAGPALAEDCVQDTLLLALLRLQSLREPCLFENWLRGIAIRVCRRTRARLAPHAPLPPVDEQLGTWLLGPGQAPSLDETLVSTDLVRSVRSAVADLPTGQRRAVEMFYLRGLSYDEAAGALAIPVGALKTRLHKARAALARYFRLDDGPRPHRLDDRTLSVHEAAHAVLGWQAGDRVLHIAITPRAEVHLGLVQLAYPRGGIAPGARLIAVMAGEAGVARALPHRRRLDSGDRATAARIARVMTGGDDVESALAITNGLDAARRRLEDPTTWALVERVAEALVIRRTLDADEFRWLVTR